MEKGSHTRWHCSFIADHGSNIRVVHNKSLPVEKFDLSSKDSLKQICDTKEPSAIYDVLEEQLHVCFSRYTVHIVICSTSEEVVGNYSVVWGEGSLAEGSSVSVKLIHTSGPSSVSGSTSLHVKQYAVCGSDTTKKHCICDCQLASALTALMHSRSHTNLTTSTIMQFYRLIKGR